MVLLRWKKSPFLCTPAFIFCLPWGRPCGNHAKRCMNEKNSVLDKPVAACTHLSSTVSQLFELQVQKLAVFTYHSPHFCFPWRRPCDYHPILHGWNIINRDAPGAITLNVVWMEREFDAYKLSRCMCPSNYNRFWDTARYWSKIVNFFIPPCIRRPHYGGSRRNSATPFGMEKLEWLGYPMVNKLWSYLYSFWRNSRTWRTDRWMDTGWRQ